MNELQIAFSKLNSKVAALEWTTDAANGQLEGLDWIDADLNFLFELAGVQRNI